MDMRLTLLLLFCLVTATSAEGKIVCFCMEICLCKRTLLPTGSEEREVLGVGSIPVAILPSCQDMKPIAL